MNKDASLRLSEAQALDNAERALSRRLFQKADEACNAVLRNSPRSSRAYFLLGISALQQNRFEDAIQRLKRALRIVPDDIDANLAMAQAFAARNLHEQAEEWFQRAHGLAPGNLQILGLLILCLMNQGKFHAALIHLDRFLVLNPRDADAFNKRGYIMQQFDRHQEAISNFTRALLLQPEFPEALNNRANSLKSLERNAEAIEDYDSAISQRPEYILPYSNRSLSLLQMGRAEEALESCDRALALNAQFPDALNNKGFILQKLQRFEESVIYLKQALAINPHHWGSLNNMASSLQQLGRLDESADCYEELLKLRPEYPEAMWNRGLLKLLRGDMPSGWSDMEWRWKCRQFINKPGMAGIPEWCGEDIRGTSIVVFAEQGYGDLFQFCRYLPKLADLGARVTLVAPSTVHRLLTTLDRRVQIVAPGQTLRNIDYQCTLLGLPDRFRTELSTIPADIPYLHAEDALVRHWSNRIPADGVRVGLYWQGNPTGAVDLGRSIPLAKLIPLSQIEGVHLISLQYQHGVEQIAEVSSRMTLQVLPGFNQKPDGFLDTAAVMKNLDLVITSDSAPAHLAGAMNVPVWVLLKSVPDWRWLLERSDSPWYPSMKLFRQEESGNWASVIGEVADSLRDVASRKRSF